MKCEECGSRTEERVHINPHGLDTSGDTVQGLLYDRIEGSEFQMCRDPNCDWRLYVSKQGLDAISRLQRGEKVENYREGGNSMEPRISSRQPVTLEPVDPNALERGDIVLVRVKGHVYTHLVTAVQGRRVQIGNNRGKINGWTPKHKVYGIVTEIDGEPVGGSRHKSTMKCPECGCEIRDHYKRALGGDACPTCNTGCTRERDFA